MESHHYNVDINWENSRKGILCSPELNKKKAFVMKLQHHQNSQKE